jgi:hypothetical protein
MPRAPFKFYDRFGRPMQRQISKAAIGSNQRKSGTGFDLDTNSLYQGQDRRALMSLGRMMYDNNPVVRGVVDEMSEITASEITAQYDGDDAEWGQAAELWMDEHDKICDVRGELFTRRTLNRLWVAHVIRDGDVGVLLTRGEGGYPQFQTIPAHRIRGDGMVMNGPWEGRKLIDGVIVNEFGRPLAYRVFHDAYGSSFEDISAVDLKLRFRPMFADQLRGVSILAASVIDFQDVDETRKFEMVAQKLAASIVLAETNELGAPMATDDALADNSAENDKDFEYRKMEGGEIQYFRSGTGGKLEALRADRPTNSQQDFINSILRQALASVGWSMDYFLDPTKIGGAPMRVAVERINRHVRGMRSDFLFPLCKTLDVWRLAVAIKLGLLPETNNIFAWRYHGAADLTADAKYAMDVAEKRMGRGLMSPQMACAEIGTDWETVQDQSIAYWARLQDRCKAAGIDPSLVASTAGTSYQLLPPVNPDPDAIPAPGAPGGAPVPEDNQ